MKLKKSILLTLLSFSLVGCSPSENTAVTPGTSDAGITNSGKEEDKTDNTSKNDNSNQNTDKDNDGKTEDKTDKDNDKDKTDKDTESEWPEKIQTEMKKYLGGQLIPYINLGKEKELFVTYETSKSASERPHLKIDGLREYDTTFVSSVITDYQVKGWQISGSGMLVIAKKDDLEVQLVYDSGFMYIEIYYDEPYDETKGTGWQEDITSVFNKYMEGHTIPYVYLGTANPYFIEWSTSTESTYIYGNGYRDEMIDNAETAFSDDEWETTLGENSNGKNLTATKKMGDGCKISVKLENYSSTNPRIRMEIVFKEAFDDTKFTSWTTDIKDAFKSYMEGHELPAIYLGSSNPDYKWTEGKQSLEITGGFWDDDVLTLAKSRLEADVDDAGNCNWKDITFGTDYYGTTLSAKRVAYDDGCSASIVISGTTTTIDKNKCKLTINYIPKIVAPKDGAWSTIVSAAMNSNVNSYSSLKILDGHEIPYVYLNTYNETVSVVTSPNRYVQVVGGKYNPNIISNALETYTKAGWTAKTVTGTFADGFEATKTFNHTVTNEDGTTTEDATHPCEITVRIPSPNSSHYYTSTVSMYIYINEGFNLNAYTDWSNDIKTSLKTYFNDFDLPVMYLGTGAVSMDLTTSNDNLRIYGGSWDDSLWTSVSSTLKAAGFTVTEPDLTSTSPILSALILDGESGTVKVTLTKYTSDAPYIVPQLDVQYISTFVEPTNGSWASDTLNQFKTYYNTDADKDINMIPYTYLHVEQGKETVNYNSTYKYLRITGGIWDDKIFTIAKTNFTSAGWDVTTGRGDYADQVIAVKENSDGTHFRIKVYKSSNDDESAKAYMDIFFDDVATSSSSTDWTTSEKEAMRGTLNGYTLPYFYIGNFNSQTMASKTKDYYYTYGACSDWSNGNIYEAEKVLKAQGYTTTMNYFNSMYSPMLRASKDVGNGSINLAFRTDSSKPILNAWFNSDFVNSTPSDYSYSADIKAKMVSVFGFEIPSVYLGTLSPSYDYDYGQRQMIVTGVGYSSGLIASAQTAFKNDTSHTWSLGYASTWLFNSDDGKLFHASTLTDDGKVVEVQITNYFYLDSTGVSFYQYPVMLIMMS